MRTSTLTRSGLVLVALLLLISLLLDVGGSATTVPPWLTALALALLAVVAVLLWRCTPLRSDQLEQVLAALQSGDLSSIGSLEKNLQESDPLWQGLKSALKARCKLLVDLRERDKEINALATGIRVCFREDMPSPDDRLLALALRLPEFWLHPEHAVARITYAGREHRSAAFAETPWRQLADFQTMDGSAGTVEVFYTRALPELDEGPFLNEERIMIGNLAALLAGYLDSHIGHCNLDATKIALTELVAVIGGAAHGNFERRVKLDGDAAGLASLANEVNDLIETLDKNMKLTNRAMRAMALGDLRISVEGQFEGAFAELQGDINGTIAQFRSILGDIQTAAGTIDIAASEIASGNADLSSRTEQQAAALEETAASMEELTSTVRGNAEKARSANQLAIGAADVAERGGRVVREVVDTMGQIHHQSRKIEDIIGVIDGIAFQTNILALNAAVGAARAGEQGRGFAVVAGEVRILAQRSAAAAREIKQLIAETVQRVDSGSQLVDSAGNTMTEILRAVKHVTDIMGEISLASAEQSSGIEQINTTVTHMDETTQQNAALVEEATAAARAMEEQAGLLTEAVARFKL